MANIGLPGFIRNKYGIEKDLTIGNDRTVLWNNVNMSADVNVMSLKPLKVPVVVNELFMACSANAFFQEGNFLRLIVHFA